MIRETIVTTMNADDTAQIAPMGIREENKLIIIAPFRPSTTLDNLKRSGAAVINLTDDVRVFARAAISNPRYETVPAAVVHGVVLADCCCWREIEVQSIDSTPPRSRIETCVVHRGTRRDFIGFSRACHAVLEAAIYATRVHLLPRAFLESELARLQVIVDKTAGAPEFEAMALLTEHVRSAPVAQRAQDKAERG